VRSAQALGLHDELGEHGDRRTLGGSQRDFADQLHGARRHREVGERERAEREADQQILGASVQETQRVAAHDPAAELGKLACIAA
jgi:hypothetical protein